MEYIQPKEAWDIYNRMKILIERMEIPAKNSFGRGEYKAGRTFRRHLRELASLIKEARKLNLEICGKHNKKPL